jgi:hypothetical protein
MDMEAPALGPSVPETGANSLGNRAALELGNRTQDGKHHLAGRSARVYLLQKAEFPAHDLKAAGGFEKV